MKGIKLVIASILASSALLCTNTYAKEKWYEVEVVVFEHADLSAAANEQWPIEPGFPTTQTAISLTELENHRDFSPVDRTDYKLDDAATRIKKTLGARVILHQAWQQEGERKSQSDAVHLFGGQLFTTAPQRQGFFSDINEEAKQFFELDGTINVSLSRYLHVDADLLFHKPMRVVDSGEKVNAKTERLEPVKVSANWQEQRDVDLKSFRLKQTSKTRPKEVLLMDHPMYGVFVMITPVERATDADIDAS